MKKFYMFFCFLIIFFCLTAFATSEVNTVSDSVVTNVKEMVLYFVYTFILALITFIFNAIRKYINKYLESKKDKSYYVALKQTEELLDPLISEAEEKAVKYIKEKYDKNKPERYLKLKNIANEVITKTEELLPEKTLKVLDETEENTRGLISKLLEKKVKESKYLKYFDFRKLRDISGIPKL